MQNRIFRQTKLMAILVGLLVILIFNSWLLQSNFKNVSEHEKWVRHTGKVMNELDLIMSSAKDAETGMRGYFLTRNIEFLQPFQKGKIDTWDHFNRIKFLIQDNENQKIALSSIETTIQKRFEILGDLLTEFQNNSNKITGREVELAEGKVTMDTLRLGIDKMRAVEQGHLESRSQNAAQSKVAFFWTLIFTTLTIVLILIITFFQIGRNQVKALIEARDKSNEAKVNETLTDLAQLIAGDLSLEKASEKILDFLSKNLGIIAGRVFMMEQYELKLVSSYGAKNDSNDITKYNSGSADEKRIDQKTSLVGAALKRNTVWEINDVPEDYWHVSSSLGEAVPKTLMLLPFKFQNYPLGVLELASFQSFSAEEKELLQKIADLIGVSLHAAQSRGHLQDLLERTQRQSEELQTQQEELRTTNEELEQQARALESQQQAISIKNSELEETQLKLQEKATELELSSQYKSEFLAKMSHELRTPLNGILILSSLLTENKTHNLSDQQRDFSRSINSAGNDLLMLINDILDLSKIEARKLSLRPEKFTLTSLLESKRTIFEPQIDAKGLKLVVDLSEDLKQFSLYTDRQRLEQILRNFLSNAIKFTESGSITLQAKVSEDKKNVSFAVIDTGIGIPQNKQRLIFDAFEQADSSVSRKYGGTGLGLTISRELAFLLGGTVSLTSEEGKGTKFSLEIPVDLKNEKDRDVQPSPFKRSDEVMRRETTIVSSSFADDRISNGLREALQNVEKNKKTILVVEDDERFRSSVVETVKIYGFQAIEVGDGEVALAVLNKHTPDAILLDIKLPGISGLGILEMIKQMPHLRHVPVHMISALDYQHNALRMGALGYLTKPVTIEKIRSALQRIESMISKNLRRLLVIEDDENQNKAISELISGSDIEVVSVKTGKAALSELKKAGFDCIILDLTLPDVSGFDLLSEIKSLDISVPPIVIYTGKDLSDEEESYLRKYSESIVIKGARSPDRLLDEVNLFLHRVESLLPNEQKAMLTQLRSQERSFEGKTVLVVDDDIRNIFAMTSALESKGLKIQVARDGIEALEKLEQEESIDLVLMDIMMPRMDGFEAMTMIRKNKNPRIRNMPVVALTAKAMKEDHEKCMEAGASDYLPKPVNLDNLITVLKVWLAPKGFLS